VFRPQEGLEFGIEQRLFYASTLKLHRPRSQSRLHFDMGNPWQIHLEKYFTSTRRLLPADMLERWPQICRVRLPFILLTTNCFVCTTANSMKCLVNWIPLRIRVRLTNTQPHLVIFRMRFISNRGDYGQDCYDNFQGF